MMSPHFYQRGQVALVTLLIMVVMLTVGLSVSTRTTQDLRLTSLEESSGQAFQAAESGIEEAFSLDLSNDELFGQDDQYTGQLGGDGSGIEGSNVEYTITRQRVVDTRLQQGVAAQVITTGAVNGNTLAIDWGRGQSCTGTPSTSGATLLVRVFNNSSGVWTVRHHAYAACEYPNSYPTVNAENQNGQVWRAAVPLQTNDAFVRIEPIFNDTTVYVSALEAWLIPPQSYQVRSTAQTNEDNVSKAIEVTRTAPAYSNVFDYVLYSGTTITK